MYGFLYVFYMFLIRKLNKNSIIYDIRCKMGGMSIKNCTYKFLCLQVSSGLEYGILHQQMKPLESQKDNISESWIFVTVVFFLPTPICNVFVQKFFVKRLVKPAGFIAIIENGKLMGLNLNDQFPDTKHPFFEAFCFSKIRKNWTSAPKKRFGLGVMDGQQFFDVGQLHVTCCCSAGLKKINHIASQIPNA